MTGRALAGCLLGMVCMAQDDPTFRTTTRLIEVSVVVVDKKGQPLTDLKQEEFTLLENGSPRKIAFFHYDGAAPARTVGTLADNLFTNRVEYTPGPPRSVIAVVVDALNTAPEDQSRIRTEVRRYLREIPANSRVAVLVLGARLTVLHDFTENTEALRARLQEAPLELPAQGTAEGQGHETAIQKRVAMTLSALEALAHHLVGVPGRKNLVWIGAGIPSLAVYGQGMGAGGGSTNYEEAIRKAAQHIAQYGCALYIVDVRGIAAPVSASAPGPETGTTDLEAINADTRPAMYQMASITGGRALTSGNDISAGLRQASNDVRGSYSLGFYETADADNKWHSVKVRVSRPGAEVLHREGYIAETVAERPAAWTNEQWRAAIGTPTGSSAILLNARVMPGEQAGTISVDLEIEPNDVYFRLVKDVLRAELEMCVALVSPDGKVALRQETANLLLSPAKWKDAQEVGIPYHRVWKSAPGATKIRVIVRDKVTGKYGSLDIPLK